MQQARVLLRGDWTWRIERAAATPAWRLVVEGEQQKGKRLTCSPRPEDEGYYDACFIMSSRSAAVQLVRTVEYGLAGVLAAICSRFHGQCLDDLEDIFLLLRVNFGEATPWGSLREARSGAAESGRHRRYHVLREWPGHLHLATLTDPFHPYSVLKASGSSSGSCSGSCSGSSSGRGNDEDGRLVYVVERRSGGGGGGGLFRLIVKGGYYGAGVVRVASSVAECEAVLAEVLARPPRRS